MSDEHKLYLYACRAVRSFVRQNHAIKPHYRWAMLKLVNLIESVLNQPCESTTSPSGSGRRHKPVPPRVK